MELGIEKLILLKDWVIIICYIINDLKVVTINRQE